MEKFIFRKLCLCIMLLVFFVSAKPQSHNSQIRVLKFEVDSLTNVPIDHKLVYIVCNDSIIAKGMTFKNGHVSLRIDANIKDCDGKLVIRQDEEMIFGINLSCFQNEKTVVLPTMKVLLVQDEFINVDNLYDALRQDPEMDWKCIYDTSPLSENSLRPNYFPPEKVTYSYDGYMKMMREINWSDNFFEVVGHYPSEYELDSMAKHFMHEDALFMNNYCSIRLAMLREPILFDSCLTDTYRFTWFVNNDYYHAFDPYSIRIVPNNSKDALMYVSCCYLDCCESTTLICYVIPIPETSYNEFLGYFDEMCFYKKTSIIESAFFEFPSTSILEANIDGQYHVIFRGEGEDPALDELQKFLWSLTRLGENKIVHKRQRIE